MPLPFGGPPIFTPNTMAFPQGAPPGMIMPGPGPSQFVTMPQQYAPQQFAPQQFAPQQFAQQPYPQRQSVPARQPVLAQGNGRQPTKALGKVDEDAPRSAQLPSPEQLGLAMPARAAVNTLPSPEQLGVAQPHIAAVTAPGRGN
jgi:hypothetical protein